MIVVDARGHRCPTPTLKLGRAMREAEPDARITLLATDPMARIDVPHMVAQMGGEVIGITEADGVLSIEIRTSAAPAV